MYAIPRYRDHSNDIQPGIPGKMSHGKCVYPIAAAGKETIFAAEKIKLHSKKVNQIALRGGCWFVIEGGPRVDANGQYTVHKLTIRMTDLKELLELGNFTAKSHNRYHAVKNLQCTQNCQLCRQT